MSIKISQRDKKLIKRHRYILEKLASSSLSQRKKILNNAPDPLFKTINVIIKLILKNKDQIPKKHYQPLSRHKKLLKSVSELKDIQSVKQKLKNQRGSFIPIVIQAAIPVITSLMKKLI